jgi:hypothetical protein
MRYKKGKRVIKCLRVFFLNEAKALPFVLNKKKDARLINGKLII